MFPALLASLLPKVTGPALVILLIIAGLGGTYWLGYDKAKTDCENRQLTANEEHYKAMQKDYWTVRQTVNALEDRLLKVREKTKIIKEEVKVYVQPDKDKLCGPDAAIVGLLNDARNPAVSVTTAQPVAESATTGEVTYSAQIIDTLDITERYNTLMLQHNALIDWIETHYGKVQPN